MSIVFALLGAFSQALTSVLQRLANIAGSDQKRSMWATTVFLVRQPLWLLGMVYVGGTFVFTALALYFGERWPPCSPSWSPSSSSPWLFAPSGCTDATGTADLGCRRSSLCRPHRVPGGCSTPRRTRPSHRGRLGGGRREPIGPGRGADHRQSVGVAAPSRAALLGAAAALVWAIDAAFVEAPMLWLVAAGWAFPALVGVTVVLSGVVGTILPRVGLAMGPLAASQSALLIVDPLASIALGSSCFANSSTTRRSPSPSRCLPPPHVRRVVLLSR